MIPFRFDWLWGTPREMRQLSAQDRGNALRRAHAALNETGASLSWRSRLIGEMVAIPALTFLIVFHIVGDVRRPAVLEWALMVGGWAMLLADFVQGQMHWRRAIEKAMRELNLRPAVCFKCGYDLHGSEAENCPECGLNLPVTKNRIDEW